MAWKKGDRVWVTSGGEHLREAEVTRVLPSGSVEVSGSSTRWRADGTPSAADTQGCGWKLVRCENEEGR